MVGRFLVLIASGNEYSILIRPTIGWTNLVLTANGNEYSILIRPTNGWTNFSTNCKWQ